MIRSLCTGIAAFALMTGAALAQTTYSSSTTTVTRSADTPSWQQASEEDRTYDRDRTYERDTDRYRKETHPGAHALGGGVAGAGLGAAIGCIVTIPIGCAPGAAIGAAVGGGTGAVVGAATTPAPREHDRPAD
jgi:hypothetical protein